MLLKMLRKPRLAKMLSHGYSQFIIYSPTRTIGFFSAIGRSFRAKHISFLIAFLFFIFASNTIDAYLKISFLDQTLRKIVLKPLESSSARRLSADSLKIVRSQDLGPKTPTVISNLLSGADTDLFKRSADHGFFQNVENFLEADIRLQPSVMSSSANLTLAQRITAEKPTARFHYLISQVEPFSETNFLHNANFANFSNRSTFFTERMWSDLNSVAYHQDRDFDTLDSRNSNLLENVNYQNNEKIFSMVQLPKDDFVSLEDRLQGLIQKKQLKVILPPENILSFIPATGKVRSTDDAYESPSNFVSPRPKSRPNISGNLVREVVRDRNSNWKGYKGSLFRIIGIFKTQVSGSWILLEDDKGRVHELRELDQLGVWTFTEVRNNKVVFRSGQRKLLLTLNEKVSAFEN